MKKETRIIITGAAGLVGQNLVLLLREMGYTNLVGIDKNTENLKTLKELNPGLETVDADLAQAGGWEHVFEKDAFVVMLHAQITGLYEKDFIDNNIIATRLIVEQIKKHDIAYTVHISSSVVNSIADDFYTQTKTTQEKEVLASKIRGCVLRPTLMFGLFDPKHLGWLSRFMAKVPVFPIPGSGKYLRQPLYSRDFCRVIAACMEQEITDKVYDIVGEDQIDYIDMIKLIKKVAQLKTWIVRIPYGLFSMLLKIYALFSKKPPFTADQLDALTAGDFFTGVNPKDTFGIEFTPIEEAFKQTYANPKYSKIELARS